MKANHHDHLNTHVEGCPVYVLDPKLQDGQKIPKLNQQLCLVPFLGFINVNSSLVANICHLSTGYVSPQYYLVFDYLFETVFITRNDSLLDDFHNYISDSDCNFHIYDDDLTSYNPLVYHVNLIIMLIVMNLKDTFASSTIMNKSNGLIRSLMNYPTRFHI